MAAIISVSQLPALGNWQAAANPSTSGKVASRPASRSHIEHHKTGSRSVGLGRSVSGLQLMLQKTDANIPRSPTTKALLSPVKLAKPANKFVISGKYSIVAPKKVLSKPDNYKGTHLYFSQVIDQLAKAGQSNEQLRQSSFNYYSKKTISMATQEDERTKTPKDQRSILKHKIEKHEVKSSPHSPIKVKVSKNLEISSKVKRQESSYFVRHLQSMPSSLLAGKSSRLKHPAIDLYIDQAIDTLKLMKWDTIAQKAARRPFKRRHPDRKLLVLDLDETLIHCTGDRSQAAKYDLEVDFVTHEGVQLTGYMNSRPYVTEFLASVSEHFEVVVYTASMKYYADTILKIIDPQSRFVSQAFYRESCARTTSNKLIKDLSILDGVSLDQIILVDNNIYCMWLQPENGVPILHFDFNRNDRELEYLEQFLIQLKPEIDHRPILRRHFKLPAMFSALDKKQYTDLFA